LLWGPPESGWEAFWRHLVDEASWSCPIPVMPASRRTFASTCNRLCGRSRARDKHRPPFVDPNSSAVVSETGQQLQIALQPNTAAYNGVYSNSTYNLSGRMVQVELAQPVNQAGWCEDFIQVVLDANNYFLIDAGSGSMVFRSMVNGVNNQSVLATFDPAAEHYWRVRHDQTANMINFETSADGTKWTIRKSAAVGFSLTSLRFYLYAGAWGTGKGTPGTAKYDNFQLISSANARVNVALAANGATASASSTYSSAYPASGTNDGDRKGANWGNGGGWNDATTDYPDWLQIDFGDSKTINEIDVFTIQDNYASPSEPTMDMIFGSYGITAFDVQYLNGSSWVTLPGGSVTGNNKVWRKFTFSPITTTKIRVLVNNSLYYYSRLAEVEAWIPWCQILACRRQPIDSRSRSPSTIKLDCNSIVLKLGLLAFNAAD